MKAREMLTHQLPNLTSSQSLGEFLQESSFWIEESGGMNAFGGWSGEKREVNEGGEGVFIAPPL